MATKTDLMKQMKEVQKRIDGGKIKGKKKLSAARHKVASLKWRAKKLADTKIPLVTIVAKKPAIPKRQAKHELVPGQGFLPTFLKQMDMVKIQELVAQKLYEDIKSQLGLAEKMMTEVEAIETHALHQGEPVEITWSNSKKKNG